MSEEINNYVDGISEREGLKRLPVSETHTSKQINDNKHTCQWVKEERQAHPTLTSYVCNHPKCGRGKLIDEKTDSIENY